MTLKLNGLYLGYNPEVPDYDHRGFWLPKPTAYGFMGMVAALHHGSEFPFHLLRIHSRPSLHQIIRFMAERAGEGNRHYHYALVDFITNIFRSSHSANYYSRYYPENAYAWMNNANLTHVSSNRKLEYAQLSSSEKVRYHFVNMVKATTFVPIKDSAEWLLGAAGLDLSDFDALFVDYFQGHHSLNPV